MKSIIILPFCFLFIYQSFTSNFVLTDTIPQNINKYTKEQFLKEYGTDEISVKIIRYYFYRSKNAKNSLYIFSALTVVTAIFGISLLTATGGGLSVLLGAGALVYTVSFIFGFFQGLKRIKKYSPLKLYEQLLDYQAGNPLPKKLKRQIRYFTRK
jgi:hypothetical protein